MTHNRQDPRTWSMLRLTQRYADRSRLNALATCIPPGEPVAARPAAAD